MTAAVLATRWPGAVAARLPGLAKAALACSGTYVLLCAYPLYELLAGGARPQARIRDPATSGADAANLVVPTPLTALRPGTDAAAAQLRAHPGEQGGYVGLLVLAVLAAAVLVRTTTARTVATVGLVLFLLSLGTTLVVLGRDTGVPMPWALVDHVPLVAQAEPVRLQVFVALCVAVVLALWLDRLLAHGRTAAVGATLVALATWVPADGQVATPVTVPAFFPQAAQQLRPDDVVETVPRASGAWLGGADPLIWQVASGMAYRMSGGYFIGSDAQHSLLLEAPVGEFQRGVAAAAGEGPPADPRAAERELRADGVTVVLVVAQPSPDRRAALTWTRQVTGSPGRLVDDVWVFRLSP
ncbi:hypothetical protein BJF78_33580 [Pseudonocardia sp. CNS-139]|nr:hypothetical protein BJF78_33580 [Pseudonocardia sp. CNS-139]